MIHTHTNKGENKKYRYYVCTHAQKRGWDNCPSKSIPAAEIERFVIDQIRSVAADPNLIAATVDEARRQIEESLSGFEAERRATERDVSRANGEIRELVGTRETPHTTARLADLQERIQAGERRLTEIREETERLRGELVTEDEVADSLREFDPVWEQLSPREQARVLELLIERVDYDGEAETVSVTFRPTGFREIAEELLLEEAVA